MKTKLLLITSLLCASFVIKAQTPPPPPPPPLPGQHDSLQRGEVKIGQAPDSTELFTFAERMPEFIGEGGFMQYLSTHIKYPQLEKESGKHGTVYIGFIVEKDGSITDVHELKGVPGAPGLTKEAIRVLSTMPKWKPGQMNGKPVRVQMTQPIKFVLDNGPSKPYVYVKPSFPGGDVALEDYIKRNIVYPPKEKKKSKEGKVVVSFMVNKDGTLTDIKVMQEVPHAPGFTKEALRLVKEMPKWIPPTYNGVNTEGVASVTVEFKL